MTTESAGRSRPNIVFILTDDHAAHSIGAYGSKINQTPQLDRIAADGARLDSCFCTNSICSPSRATILSGTYSHINGVTSVYSNIEYRVPNFTQCLRESGYRTALFGKWHLGHQEPHLPRPQDFDAWQVFPGQGEYNDPKMITADGEVTVPGYATDIVTDLSLSWLDQLRSEGSEDPFCLMVHHKAPHRPWVPDPKHRDLYPVGSIPEPETLFDDFATRGRAAHEARMTIADDLNPETDIKEPIPAELQGEENREARIHWAYQRYLRDYLQTVQSVDDNVGRVLDYLDDHGLSDNTIVVYTSDQGFFLGDHGWFDKRFIYEQSLQMPFLIKWPGHVEPGTVVDEMITNTDFAATFLEAAGLDAAQVLPTSQGRSFAGVLRGQVPDDWQQAMYYRYWEHDDPSHHAWAHYGIRTRTHKLVYFYADGLGTVGSSDRVFEPEWEMYDLVADPQELNNIADDPAAQPIRTELEEQLAALQKQFGDQPYQRV